MEYSVFFVIFLVIFLVLLFLTLFFFLLGLLLLHLDLVDELCEVAFWPFSEHCWSVKLCNFSSVEDKHTVTLDNSLQSVCNHNHRTILEAFFDQFLNYLFSLDINIGGSFIKDNDLVLSENSTADTEKRLFTRTQIFTTRLNLVIE